MADVLAHILVLCRIAEQDSVEIAVEYENCLVGTLSTFSGQGRQFNTRNFLTGIVPQSLKDAREAPAPAASKGAAHADAAPSIVEPNVKQKGGRGPTAAPPGQGGGKPSTAPAQPLERPVCLFHQLKVGKSCTKGSRVPL